MSFDLAFIWAGLIAFAVLAYVVLDGFDLGIGILLTFVRNGEERGAMINTVTPVWDGNETWQVLGGGGLMAAFPLAYATVLPALYAPLIAMLLGLILRGVAFEFRWRSRRRACVWDGAFALGSLIASLAQGLALGALVQGIKVVNRSYAGGWWDWFTPFSVLTSLALVIAYALLGACWLVMKTAGPLQQWARRKAMLAGIGMLAVISAVSLWTPFLNAAYAARWLAWPTLLFSAVVPLLVGTCGYVLFKGLIAGHERRPFFAAIGLFVLSFSGLGISFYPYIVPPALTIWQAAAPDKTER